MKKIVPALILLAIATVCQSCFWVPVTDEPDDGFEPVTMSRTELENSVMIMPPQNIVKSGKIYIKDNLMFINDVNKGFHAYNYSDPENPVAIGFIKVPGATDLAIRGEFVYINQAVDLITLVYNATNNTIAVSHRNQNVFPQKMSPSGIEHDIPNNHIIIDWIEQ